MKLIIGNNVTKTVIGGSDNLLDNIRKKLYEYLKVMADGYWFSEKFKTHKYECLSCGFQFRIEGGICCEHCDSINIEDLGPIWDGSLTYLNKNGTFLTGFLPMVYDYLLSENCKVELIDNRDNLIQFNEVVTQIGDETLFNFQKLAVENIINNKVGDIPFNRGTINIATNGGKTYVAASLYLTCKRKTLFIIHNVNLFNQHVKFYTSIGIEVSQFNSTKKEFGDFTIAMVKSLNNSVKKVNIKKQLSEVDVLIVDESHRAASTTYKRIIRYCNASCRVFMSGTALDLTSDSKLMDIIGQSGIELINVTNQQLIDLEVSQKPTVFMINYSQDNFYKDSYFEEKDKAKFSPYKMKVIQDICQNTDQQILIILEHIEHGYFILSELLHLNIFVDFVQGSDKDREEKFDNFNSKKTQVLISTMIVKEGLNLKEANIGINLYGNKSIITLKQTMGRILRMNDSGNTCIWIDFNDMSRRLGNHTSKRIKLYESEGFEIIYQDHFY